MEDIAEAGGVTASTAGWVLNTECLSQARVQCSLPVPSSRGGHNAPYQCLPGSDEVPSEQVFAQVRHTQASEQSTQGE